MKVDAYVKSAATILAQYDGKVPFAAFLKDYFRKEKKFGSRDRRTVGQLCFGYFRLGGLFHQMPLEARIHESIAVLEGTIAPVAAEAIFPLREHLSPEIDAEAFALSHLVQPHMFLRTRPGKERGVQAKLLDAGIPFTACGDDCLALSNGSKIEEVIRLDEEAVVQDRSSQLVLTDLQAALAAERRFSLWDCCAASGGKSILARDRFPSVQLTVSDVRESILHNLRARFRRAGIDNYRSFVADASIDDFGLPHKFNAVLCDAPCSGSGTWGRTPEQLTYFTEDRIAHYAQLQKRIARNAARQVAKGGYFVYITCSVFAAENEEVVAWLQKESGLTLRSTRYFKGYAQKADTLFAALFEL